ncbi:exosortase/archaeosortase family protein [Sphingomonas sp. BGYR3]|uniref:exosortase/archaeosortase family protein n=1 Tax=Sphingomonas sp. BGYR3 TaxID=2975483 RepID=UPI0021A31FDB|nr:exosortase/archaeosortase family protein [Sphingomonas sp. BGYR3]MDG5489242.1 exosortase/archaeosortase family protein [Sphingomonas sp. BGYR3]
MGAATIVKSMDRNAPSRADASDSASDRGTPMRVVPGDALTLFGLVVIAAPVIVDQATGAWRTEQGAHGPFLLMLGVWLIVRQLGGPLTPPGRVPWPLWAGLAVSLVGYLAARRVDFVWVEWIVVMAVAAMAAYHRGGMPLARQMAFPLLFMALLVPPPSLISAPAILTLSLWLSDVAAAIFWQLGVPASSSDAMIHLGPYDLRVAEACAGMGSLVGLFAVGMLYLHLRHRGDWRRAWLVVPLIVPIAVAANLARILTLMGITIEFGDRIAQGWVHPVAGLILFAFAMAMLIALDRLMTGPRKEAAA